MYNGETEQIVKRVSIRKQGFSKTPNHMLILGGKIHDSDRINKYEQETNHFTNEVQNQFIKQTNKSMKMDFKKKISSTVTQSEQRKKKRRSFYFHYLEIFIFFFLTENRFFLFEKEKNLKGSEREK